MIDRCLACDGTELEQIADLGDTPVLVGVLAEGADAARAMAVGALVLAACRTCGHVQNVAFDARLVDYDASYDNSLYFSPTFRQYADELAHRLVERYDVKGGRVVEIGSGAGDFLSAVCAAGGNVGVGYDPSTPAGDPAPGVTLVADYYRPEEQLDRFDLLVCRHVLEHLDDPYSVLAALAAADPDRHGVMYLEVPSAEFNFGPEGLWDCIYPHVSYFSAGSLRALVTRAGLEVIDAGTAFDGQFLYVEARGARAPQSMAVTDPAPQLDLVRDFARRRDEVVAEWRAHVEEAEGGVVLWGAGAKGVTFANAIDAAGRLTVVDLNPRKWGQYLPGTAHEVIEPNALSSRDVSSVLVTNPIYAAEIREQLDALGVRAETLTV